MIVVLTLDFTGSYNLSGMWITIPDYAQRLNDPTDLFERVFTRLNGWDGHWYHHIAQNGYQCPGIPESNNPYSCNVSFFPLVPGLGAGLGAGLGYLGIDLVYALPLISQLCWFATILLILFLLRSITSIQAHHILLVVLLVSYPGAFYGFTPYAETSFCFLLVAITALSYWHLNSPRSVTLVMLAIACFMVSLSKASGIIALAIPVLMSLFDPGRGANWISRKQREVYLASSAGLIGIFGFLIFCEIQFGDWALYYHYVGSAWAGGANSGMSINPLSIFTHFEWHTHLPIRVSNILMVTLPGIILILAIVLRKIIPGTRHLFIALLITNLILFYFYSTLGNTGEFRNFNITRHMLPVYILTGISAMLVPQRYSKPIKIILNLSLVGLISLSFYYQIAMLNVFKVGGWVS